MQTKICKKCNELKLLSEYNLRTASKDGYRYECKLCQKRISKTFYQKNKETICYKTKEYYENNLESVKERHVKYYQDNKDKILNRTKLNQKNNKEVYNERSKLWASNNPNRVTEHQINFKNKNPNYHSNYISTRKKNDPLFKLTVNIRRRILHFLVKNDITKNNKTFEIVGCSPIELKEYLQQKFIEGMTWENQGKWHVDHIIPLSSAKTIEEVYELCYYTNLQPLWGEENLKKGNKLNYEIK
jgi:hypothetical protein